MKVSKHAKERAKERHGLSEKAIERLLPRILSKGKRVSDMKHGSLRRFINWYSSKYGYEGEIILYGKNLYVFYNDKLITTFGLPNHLKNKKGLWQL